MAAFKGRTCPVCAEKSVVTTYGYPMCENVVCMYAWPNESSYDSTLTDWLRGSSTPYAPAAPVEAEYLEKGLYEDLNSLVSSVTQSTLDEVAVGMQMVKNHNLAKLDEPNLPVEERFRFMTENSVLTRMITWVETEKKSRA